MQIIGGRIVFARSVQPAQYETKKAEVELTFTMAEGEELGAHLDQLGARVQAKALELVGLKVNGNAGPSLGAVKDPAIPAKVTEDKPKGKTKKDLEAEKAAELAKSAEAAEATKPKVTFPKSDPADMSEADKPQISSGGERTDPAAVTSDDELFEAAAPDVTDVDLTSAITRKNAEIKKPAEIKKLIGQYVQPPKGSRDIPQPQRRDFLEKLKLLTA